GATPCRAPVPVRVCSMRGGHAGEPGHLAMDAQRLSGRRNSAAGRFVSPHVHAMTTSATPLSRLRALWLSRRSRCPGCGYDLAGLTVDDEGICPECGRAVTRS